MIYNSASDIDAVGYDKIIEETLANGNKVTYVMRYDASKLDKSVSHENQPIWQIKRIRENNFDGLTITIIDYPNGLNGYIFKASDYNKYTYTYRNC